MNLLQKLTRGCITLSLCMTMMVQAKTPCGKCCVRQPCFPANCCPAPCVPKKNCDQNLGLYALGVLLLGTAAGVGVGYAAGNNNHHHTHSQNEPCCPPQTVCCPPQECPCANGCGCKKLKNSVLCFELDIIEGQFSFLNSAPFDSTASLTFFAVTPNGCTIEGDTASIPISIGDDEETFGPVVIELAFHAECCGTYQLGATLTSPFVLGTVASVVPPATLNSIPALGFTALLQYFLSAVTNCPSQNSVGLGLPISSTVPDTGSESVFGGNGVTQVVFQLGQYELSPACCIVSSSSCSCSE